SNSAMLTLVRTLKQLGCHTVIITNAAGSLREDTPPGELMLINDHINLQFNNVLVGCFGEDYESPFVSLEDAYCPELRQGFKAAAKQLGTQLTEGVYIGVLGPSFETPAEIRAFARLGADCVAMSMIPEVIAARHCGLKVAAISTITNMASGMSHEKLSHQQTLRVAKQTCQKLTDLISTFLQHHYAKPTIEA
ncbi:unnamed protein product, partial [marine sediment metagenome]